MSDTHDCGGEAAAYVLGALEPDRGGVRFAGTSSSARYAATRLTPSEA